jgi:hypothetical protein
VGVIGNLLLLPLAPVRGLAWVTEVITEEAEREIAANADPARRLEELGAKTATGEITPEEAARLEEELIEQLLADERQAYE